MFQSNFDNFSRAGHNQHSQSWKPEPDDYVWHPKHTHTICGAVSIVSCQYGRKIIRSSFADFPGIGTTDAGKVENWSRMTLFCTRNIPTQFGTHFLLFLIRTGKNGLYQIFPTFSGSGTTGKWKVENEALTTRFSTRNVPKLCGVQFLSFRISTTKKIFLSNFDDFSGAGHNRPSQSWKPEPDDYVWHPKHTHTIGGAVSIISGQYGRKIIRSSFADFFLGTSEAGRVENWFRMTSFCTRNIPTLFGTHFLSFLIRRAEKCFRQILTTFSGWAQPLQAELKIGPGWLSFDSRNIPPLFGTHF